MLVLYALFLLLNTIIRNENIRFDKKNGIIVVNLKNVYKILMPEIDRQVSGYPRYQREIFARTCPFGRLRRSSRIIDYLIFTKDLRVFFNVKSDSLKNFTDSGIQ